MQSISLDPQTPIRAVRAYQGKGQRRGYLYRMSFIDGDGNEAYCYNPDNDQDDQTEYRLADNEELIGVYGVYGNIINTLSVTPNDNNLAQVALIKVNARYRYGFKSIISAFEVAPQYSTESEVRLGRLPRC